jgi:hypothetical protein
MGHLDEPGFAAKLAPCGGCGGTRFELRSYIDQRVPVMLGDAAGAPRWVHDGEKFVDGTYRITCAGCKQVVFASDDCPRCHAAGALPTASTSMSRIAVPRTCPTCKNTELEITAMVPALAAHGGGKTVPKALAELGDPGFHVVEIECDDCGTVTDSGDACTICGAPGPLRPRP